MVTPFLHFCRNCLQNSKSSRWWIFSMTDRLYCADVHNNRSRLSKCKICGWITLMWFIQSIIVSNSLWIVLLLVRIKYIDRFQAIHLCRGNLTSNRLVSMSQPRTVFISDRTPSAISLWRQMRSGLGMGSLVVRGRPTVCIYKGTTALSRLLLSLTSTVIVIVSSM